MPTRPIPLEWAGIPASRRLAHFALDAAACIRLTQLVVSDEITAPLRERVWAKHPVEHGIGFAVSCPFCSAIWVSALVMVARSFAPRAWQPVAEGLTLAAVAGETAARLSH